MSAGIFTSKAFLVVIGLVFWGMAAGFGYLGGSIWQQYGHIDEIAKSYYTLIPGATLIGTALLALLVGILICCSACSKNRCLLAVVFCILLTIFLAQLSSAVLGYMYRNKLDSMLEHGMHDAVEQYGDPSHDEVTSQVDYIQRELDCCGVINYTDWFNTPWGMNHTRRVPGSCCKRGDNCTDAAEPIPAAGGNSTRSIHTSGCLTTLHNDMRHSLALIVGVGLGFALLQILGMVAACVLFCRSRNENNPYRGLDGEQPVQGLRV